MTDPRLNIISRQKIIFLSKRMIFCLLMLLAYIYLLRPARVAFTEQVAYPQFQRIQPELTASKANLQGGSILIRYKLGENTKSLSYRPEFGFFFLVAILALVLLSYQPRHYLWLLVLHLGASLLTYLFLLLGASGFMPGFVLLDIVGGYLTPALSLALVPWVMAARSRED